MKTIHIMGGGTFAHVRPHLALAAPAFGGTARQIYGHVVHSKLVEYSCGGASYFEGMEAKLWLSKMAHSETPRSYGDWVTNEDVAATVDQLIADPETKVIFFSVALCDYTGNVLDRSKYNEERGEFGTVTPSGKDQPRLSTSLGKQLLELMPAEKILGRIRKERKDIFLVAFKTTAGATPQEQYEAGLTLLKRNSCNLVLANDFHTRLNMVVVPELGRYYETTDRKVAIEGLVKMASARHNLTFTKTNIQPGKLLPWSDPKVPDTLRQVVDHCVARGAYRPFNNVTVGHFGFMEGHVNNLWSSRRKRNYNNPEDRDLVGVSFGPEGVVAYGQKPSAGVTSQKHVLGSLFPQYDCIVHFHCPLKPGSTVNVRPQHDFECGSLECGLNTRDGMTEHAHPSGHRLTAVMLDQHGPNILFNRYTPAEHIIAFIEQNFDLTRRTGDSI